MGLWAGIHSAALVIVTGLTSVLSRGPLGRDSFGFQRGITDTSTTPDSPLGRVSSIS